MELQTEKRVTQVHPEQDENKGRLLTDHQDGKRTKDYKTPSSINPSEFP